MSDTARGLWGIIEPYVAAEGVELDDVEVLGSGSAQIVRVTIDAPEPIDVDRIARLSRGLSRMLDSEDPIEASYTLEVSSPGLERRLRRSRHYEKSVGRELTVKTTVPVEEMTSHRGVLVCADEKGFVIAVDDTKRRIEYVDVASARTVFVWERGAKRRH
ncbi:MAG TPA: ribosome maturation factor RimP [Acidimicrobiia bacterium]